jgi:phosphocarrier protein HPr
MTAAPEGVLRRMLTIANQRGLHARAAAKFVRVASQFDAEIIVERNGSAVGGQSIMGLMMLSAGIGSVIAVTASGREAAAALAAIADLVERRFDEE